MPTMPTPSIPTPSTPPPSNPAPQKAPIPGGLKLYAGAVPYPGGSQKIGISYTQSLPGQRAQETTVETKGGTPDPEIEAFVSSAADDVAKEMSKNGMAPGKIYQSFQLEGAVGGPFSVKLVPGSTKITGAASYTAPGAALQSFQNAVSNALEARGGQMPHGYASPHN
jgi:hypothetical protein